MPRAKLRNEGKWHEQHRLCCVTHSMREHRLQSGETTTVNRGPRQRAPPSALTTRQRNSTVFDQGFRAYNVGHGQSQRLNLRVVESRTPSASEHAYNASEVPGSTVGPGQTEAPASCGGVSQVRVAITDSVGAAAHRGSFGDPRARPAAAGFARRHSPSVHWWHSWRGRPLRREQRLLATWLVAQPVVRSVVSTAAGGGGAVAVRAVGGRSESGPG